MTIENNDAIIQEFFEAYKEMETSKGRREVLENALKQLSNGEKLLFLKLCIKHLDYLNDLNI